MAQSFEFLIVGGGNAAGYACRELVAQGVGADKVGIITAEAVAPYERPALTKAYLHPPSAKVRARLPGFHTCVGGGGERQTPEWYTEKGISFIQGKATSVDLAAKTVLVNGEKAVGYGKLIIATGTRALQVRNFGVKGDDLENVFYLREEHEAALLVKALEALSGGGKAVIVGGGYIGLEVAAALVGWGIDTTMVFPESHCLSRVFTPEIAKWMEDQYATRGVKMLKGDVAAEFLGEGGKVQGVQLKSGAALPCDVVVVGVGAVPNVDFCKELQMEKGGFRVDSFMQTSDPNVFAIGDVCAFPTASGEFTRCEHVDHARKSASQAVKAALGVEVEAYNYLPYFYSRVFEYSDAPIVFNYFGDQAGAACQVTSRGDSALGAIWVKDGKVAAALLLGSPGPSADDQAKLRSLVQNQAAAESAEAAFAAAGL